jgi:hypothetical protein
VVVFVLVVVTAEVVVNVPLVGTTVGAALVLVGITAAVVGATVVVAGLSVAVESPQAAKSKLNIKKIITNTLLKDGNKFFKTPYPLL